MIFTKYLAWILYDLSHICRPSVYCLQFSAHVHDVYYYIWTFHYKYQLETFSIRWSQQQGNNSGYWGE